MTSEAKEEGGTGDEVIKREDATREGKGEGITGRNKSITREAIGGKGERGVPKREASDAGWRVGGE